MYMYNIERTDRTVGLQVNGPQETSAPEFCTHFVSQLPLTCPYFVKYTL